MRKLRDLKNNIFTPKLKEVLIPINVQISKDEMNNFDQMNNFSNFSYLFIVMEYMPSDLDK